MRLKESLENNGFKVFLSEDDDIFFQCLGTRKALTSFLLDLVTPQTDAFRFCQKIKSDSRFADVPVLFIVDAEDKISGIHPSLVDDYIMKPFETSELVLKINERIYTKELQDELKSATKKILDQQKSVIEEERLRLLFKMIGIAGHEMGQPLMALLGNDIPNPLKKR